MHRLIPRLPHVLVAAAIAFAATLPARATILHYRSTLSGANESPPNSSTGQGNVELTIDDVGNTMRVQATFTGLTSPATASHIHGPTPAPQSGTADAATTTPSFEGFPTAVTTGSYDNTLDLTQSTSYNPTFITANGGTPGGARAALLDMLAAGKAYFDVHSNAFPDGEIRGFLAPFDVTPTRATTWGRVKALYR